jgi:hypothetical protein
MAMEVLDERVYPDTFDRFAMTMEGVELAAALSVAEVLPVRSFVAMTREAGFFDKGFQQNRAVRVTVVPVIGQAARGQRENSRGEILASDPRQDQESCVVDDQVQVSLPLFTRPADELIARLGLPSAGAEAEQSDDFARGTHEVSQLCARQGLMSEVVMALYVGVPQERLACVSQQVNTEL